MNFEKRFLLPSDKDSWVNHFALIGGCIAFVILAFLMKQYSHGNADDLKVEIGFAVVYLLVLFIIVLDEIWFCSRFSMDESGIQYGGRFMRTRFISWDSVTDIVFTELDIARGSHPQMICCCLNGSKPPRRKLHVMTYYRILRNRFFVLKYSEERYKRIFQYREKPQNTQDSSL